MTGLQICRKNSYGCLACCKAVSHYLYKLWSNLESIEYQQGTMSSCTSWWRHQMETFSALLTICAGNSPVSGEFPAQRPVTRSFDVFFDLRLNKRLSKQSWGWWFETLSRPLWRHRIVNTQPSTSSMHSVWMHYRQLNCVRVPWHVIQNRQFTTCIQSF